MKNEIPRSKWKRLTALFMATAISWSICACSAQSEISNVESLPLRKTFLASIDAQAAKVSCAAGKTLQTDRNTESDSLDVENTENEETFSAVRDSSNNKPTDDLGAATEEAGAETEESVGVEDATEFPLSVADDDEELSELAEFGESEPDELTATQRNSINMLNYIAVLTQNINDSKGSRLFLESAYSDIVNNVYPNAVDTRTQAQITGILDTLDNYRMIAVKRERLEFIYEQNQAQALRQAIPNPMGLLSAVQSKNMLESTVSVIYMAVDAASSYASASTQADLQYLKDGWELDDAESAELHNSRKAAFTYMLNIVRDNDLPGDYALNEESVKEFVEHQNKSNITSKTAWLEANQAAYVQFGPYWLELAKCYYETENYAKCLESISQYEKVVTRIFRKDYDYARALPMAIISARESLSEKDYIESAKKYALSILNNTDKKNSKDWALRYFVAQIYIDLYAKTSDTSFLDEGYKIVFDNVNNLVEEQQNLNAAYIAPINKENAGKSATKRQKDEIKEYNKLIGERRKVELPPVSEAFYLNCDLLFALAKQRNISYAEKARIESIIHDNGGSIFLTTVLDNRFWFDDHNETVLNDLPSNYSGGVLEIPASCVTDRADIAVTVVRGKETTVFTDWMVEKVIRPKNGSVEDFMAVFESKTADDFKFQEGDIVTITVIPVTEAPEETIDFVFDTVAVKKAFVFNGISFERQITR